MRIGPIGKKWQHIFEIQDGGGRHLQFWRMSICYMSFAFGVRFSTFPLKLMRQRKAMLYRPLASNRNFQGVSDPQNTKMSTRSRTFPICSGHRFSIRALKSKLPSNVKITPQSLAFDWKWNTRSSYLILAVQLEMYFSRWLPPPSWTSKMCCHCFTHGSILTKFDRNVQSMP